MVSGWGLTIPPLLCSGAFPWNPFPASQLISDSIPGPVSPSLLPTDLLSLRALLGLSCQSCLSPDSLTHAAACLLSVNPLVSWARCSSLPESPFPHLYSAESTLDKTYVTRAALPRSTGSPVAAPTLLFCFSLNSFHQSASSLITDRLLRILPHFQALWMQGCCLPTKWCPRGCAVCSSHRCTPGPCMDLLLWTRYPIL